MKTLIAALLLTLTTTPQASELDLINGKICVAVSEYADAVMDARQLGATRARIDKETKGITPSLRPFVAEMVDEAFSTQVFPRQHMKRKASLDFNMKWTLECINRMKDGTL